MKLGQLRDLLEDYATLPDDAPVGVAVEESAGDVVDMDLAEIRMWSHKGKTYLYLDIVPQQ